MGLGLVPREGVRQAHGRPHFVDPGEDCEGAGVQGPRQALLGNEGVVTLGQAGWPNATALHFSKEVYRPAPQRIGKGEDVGQAPSVQP